MRRRILTLLLAGCMALTLVPGEALAAPPEESNLPAEWGGEDLFPSEVPPEDAYYGDGYSGDAELEAYLGEGFTGFDYHGSLGEPIGGPVGESFYEPADESMGGGDMDGPPADGGPVPEFVPGAAPPEEELAYPDYEEAASPQASLESSWTTEQIQSPVEDQRPNGTCWSFGTLAAMTAHMNAIDFGQTGRNPNYNLSERHMFHCLSSESGNTQQGFDDLLETGGGREMASGYLMRGSNLSGAVRENEDPYPSGTPLTPRDLDISRIKQKAFQARNILFLTGRKEETPYDIIKQGIMYRGGVGAAYFHQDKPTYYRGAAEYFFNETYAAYCYNSAVDTNSDRASYEKPTNHVIEIVGWDDNFPKEYFNPIARPLENGAWLVKNSWGTDWGNRGYFWVSYADSHFPAYAFCFSGVDNYDPRQIVYETDYRNNGEVFGNPNAQVYYIAKVFQKKTSELEFLDSVRIFIASPFLSVEVGYFPVDNLGSNIDRTFTSLGAIGPDLGMSVGCPGWYTIPLANRPYICYGGGDRFAVAVKVTAPSAAYGGKGVYIGFDGKNSADAAPLYFSNEGQYWGIVPSNNTANLCIKAVTYPDSAQGRSQVLVDKAAGDLLWPLVNSGSPGCLNLPGQFKGASVTWTSADEDALSARTGKWQAARFDRSGTVKLTATLSYEESGEGASRKVLFNVNVGNRSATLADKAAAAQDWWTREEWWAAISGQNEDWDHVRTNLKIPPSITVSPETCAPYTLEVQNTGSVVNKDDANPLRDWVQSPGYVMRPPYGQPDVKGHFRLWLKDEAGNSLYLPSWEITVLSYKGKITPEPLPDVTASTEYGTVLEAKYRAEGAPGTVQYQWYRCNDSPTGTGVRLEGETGPRLVVRSDSQAANTRYYYCLIYGSDAVGVFTSHAAVTLIPGYATAQLYSAHLVQLYNVEIPEGASFYAACYDGNGRLSKLVKAASTYSDVLDGAENVVFVNGEVAKGWRLFCLDSRGKPLCIAPVIS